ncbi:hypothetical protein ACQEU3_30905 [Spirillospora sp. CA-253888]
MGERDVAATVVGFARTLRAAGGGADPERVHAMVRALDHLDVLDPVDVYWAGRLTLCAGPDDLARYDRCFAAYFSGAAPRPGRRVPPPVVARRVAVPQPRDAGGGEGTTTSGSPPPAARRCCAPATCPA